MPLAMAPGAKDAAHAPSTNLSTLPVELLGVVADYLPSAHSLSSLSLTCRALYNFVTHHGWKAFVRSRFPGVSLPPSPPPQFWRDAVHGLTSLSRNYDRRGVVARYVEPAGRVCVLPQGDVVERWESKGGQTMGYQPVIDSYEQWVKLPGGQVDWASRREVLAWSAGSELVLRLRWTGHAAMERRVSTLENCGPFQSHKVEWFTYRDQGVREGVDDITSLKLFKPIHRGRGAVFDLEDEEDEEFVILACLGKGEGAGVAVYRSMDCGNIDKPVLFLHTSVLAIGLGPSKDPLRVHEVLQEGISEQPIRQFQWPGYARSISVKFIAEIPKMSSAFYTENPDRLLFFTGMDFGQVFLHDLRSPTPYEFSVANPIDPNSSMYSIQPLGRDRIAVGGGRHRLLMFFDIRQRATYGGLSTYDYRDAQSNSHHPSDTNKALASRPRPQHDSAKPAPATNHDDDDNNNRQEPRTSPGDRDDDEDRPPGWSVFTYPRHHEGMRGVSSPVYSVSAPAGGASPTLYIGSEGTVMQLDALGVNDGARADPVFGVSAPGPPQAQAQPQPRARSGQTRPRSGSVNIKQAFNARGEVLALALLEHGLDAGRDAPGSLKVWVQRGVGKYAAWRKGLDERLQPNEAVVPQRARGRGLMVDEAFDEG
ncbi:hypothetical protein BDY21DRAFT_419441 [Lineolata rhizophorae]|uniref:F-box domain-containing protein n=1 Tax=Lineolata rhizophorae TaxID=578093 RepID=A0A6A6P9U0_9PEZI|nr:hypothetical protein BDY21DRAFT_419441 [Lineolata rhizophorae]